MVFWIFVGASLLVFFYLKLRKDYVLLSLAKKIKSVNGIDIESIVPTAKGTTIFGNNFDMLKLTPEGIFLSQRSRVREIQNNYTEYLLGTPILNIVRAEDAELIFNDQTLITKGVAYTFIHPFVKTGLLTSTGQKWHSRRKMLTPAFHFNILEQFHAIFKAESHKLCEYVEKNNGKVISLNDIIPRLTLNSICETALGVKLDNLEDGDSYRNHLLGIEKAMVKRIANPLYIFNTIWELFGNTDEFKRSYDGVHEFSNNIIKKRRAMFQKVKSANSNIPEDDDENNFYFKKRQYAMLDTLLEAQTEGTIDHEGICEEVDTIIFEGFDTTSMALIYGIMNLALYPEIQQKCFEEIHSMIDDDLNELTIPNVNKLEYLNAFVKETLRMYPSVPLIVREAVRDTTLANNVFLPQGTQINIHIYDIQRDPRNFENPNEFDPDRFLSKSVKSRHNFAYVPFSAGSRNCIGQKFALLEIKTVLIYFIKQFQLFQIDDPAKNRYETGFLLRVANDIRVRIVKRKQ